MNIAPLHHPNQYACIHLVIFFIHSLFFCRGGGGGGGEGVWVATKWDFFPGGGGGGGHVWATLRLRLRLGIVSGVGYTQI